ncbi:hypothetical protein RND81_14G025600 [Saponaria officinalis]|uniref:C2H2-type domain-containing protein n=1 Tax=Saponaria officinalis TaxID=3572 RepID=A0AAW1GHN3_SAPOF
MTGMELGFLKPSTPSWKEQLARKTLRNVRMQGHTYVDLREDGKGVVFFCTLCWAPCHSDDVLFDHLRGNLHKERLSAAKMTLMGSNPWPFEDGVLFFKDSVEKQKDAGGSRDLGNRIVGCGRGDFDIVVHCDVSEKGSDGHVNGNGESERDGNVCDDDDDDMGSGEGAFDLVIPSVISKEGVSDLGVRLMGYGQVCARVLRDEEVNVGIHRLWCEWLGKRGGDVDETHFGISSHDFAIVTFSYFYDLGKQSLLDEIKTFLLTGGEDGENFDDPTKRRKKSHSDSKDASETLNNQCDISGEDSQGSNSTASSALLLHHYDDRLLHSEIISSKSLRRELRRQQRMASEIMCDICQQKMLPGKDVAALLNLKTGRLACSSRNVHGAFHVFHTSCLVHWTLLCEFEMFMKPPVRPKVRRRSTRKVKPILSELGKESDGKQNTIKHSQSKKASEAETPCDRICSVFCPACQGTGAEVKDNELERPTISLSQIFKFKIKISDAQRSWMKCPEMLENCSTGFAFPVQADDVEEKVIHMKLLHFYRAGEDSWIQSAPR